MTKFLHIIIIATAMIGCNGSSRQMDDRLYLADSLANEDMTDSAMAVLNRIDIDRLNEWNSHYYDLVSVKINDKAQITHTSDSLILNAIDFFEINDNYAELTAAYYYCGRVYSDLGNTPKALDFFRKAYSRLDDSPSSLKGRIAYQMGLIFLDLFQFNEAKSRFMEAISFNTVMQDSIDLIHSYSQLGETYSQLGDGDSALTCFNDARLLAHKISPFGEAELEMRARIVNFHLNNGDYNRARNEYDSIIPYMSVENTSDYTIIAGINTFSAAENHNVVALLANRLLNSSSIQNKCLAYEVLLDVAHIRGDLNAVARYSSRYKECIDSINTLFSQESAILRNSLFNYSVREEQHITQTGKQQQLSTITIVVISLLCLFFAALVIWLYLRHKKLQKQSAQQLQKIEQLIANSAVLAEKLKSQEQKTAETKPVAPAVELSATEKLQLHFREIIANVNPKEIRVPAIILESEPYAKFKKAVDTQMSIKPDENDWLLLDEAVNRAHPGFKKNLYELYSKLSEQEYNVCMLVKCKFSPSEIATLTYRSKTSIASTRSRLCTKFFCCDGVASDCDKFILSL